MNEKALNDFKLKQNNANQIFFKLLILIASMSFTLSLFTPTFFTSAEDIYGFWVLITGWIGLIFIQLAWFANPVNLLALLIAKDKPRTALLLSFLALALVSMSFMFYEIPTGFHFEKVYIKEFGIGFYLWLIAHVCVLFALMMHLLNSLKDD